jgi:hypothetical protein
LISGRIPQMLFSFWNVYADSKPKPLVGAMPADSWTITSSRGQKWDKSGTKKGQKRDRNWVSEPVSAVGADVVKSGKAKK